MLFMISLSSSKNNSDKSLIKFSHGDEVVSFAVFKYLLLKDISCEFL